MASNTYTIQNTKQDVAYNVPENKTNTETDLTFIGYGYTNYGQPLQQNLIDLLTNFYTQTDPKTKAVPGQLIYEGGSTLTLCTKRNGLGVLEFKEIPLVAANRPATGSPIIQGTPKIGLTVTVDTTPIQDQDGLGTFSYQWYSGGAIINGETSNSLILNPVTFSAGDMISVQVSFYDGGNTYEHILSNSVAVIAADPVVAGVPVTPLPVKYSAPPTTDVDYYEYTVPAGISKINVEIIGGGGGGGGADRKIGGNGGDGAKINTTLLVGNGDINSGDVLRIYVGCGGAGGETGITNKYGRDRLPLYGAAGKLPSLVNLTTLLAATLVSGPPMVKYTYMTKRGLFLQNYSFWDVNKSAPPNGTTRTWEWDFTAPRLGNYVATLAGDDYCYLYIDGLLLIANEAALNVSAQVNLTKGTHRLKVVGKNVGGGAACVAVDISEFSTGFAYGGTGGQSAASGVGNAGAGGGASAIVKTTGAEVLVVAAGGGGGGGGDYNGVGGNATNLTTAGSYAIDPSGIVNINRAGGGGGGGGYDLVSGTNSGNGKGGAASGRNVAGRGDMPGGIGGNSGKSFVKLSAVEGGSFTNILASNKGLASTDLVPGDGGCGSVLLTPVV